MKLDHDQFEELEVDALQAFLKFATALSELDCLPDEPSEMEIAFRPTNNPNGQYFAVMLSMMVDKATGGARMEAMGFKPMDKSAYIQYCIEEYGAAPLIVDPTLN